MYKNLFQELAKVDVVNNLGPRHFLDGHISDRHFLDGQILDRAISVTLFRQVNKTGHFLDWTYFRHIIKLDTF